MGILLQAIGLLLAIIGFFAHLGWLFMIAGFLCVFLDITGFLSGKLNPLFPIFLYIGGWVIAGNWTGILWGAIIGNSIEIIIILVGGVGYLSFTKFKALFSKNKEKENE